MSASKIPTGFRDRRGYLKIAVYFPEALFKTIKQRAHSEGRSFSAQVVELCRIGEFDLSESDAMEMPSTIVKEPAT